MLNFANGSNQINAMPLSMAQVVATTDADDAAEAVGRIFCPHKLNPTAPKNKDFFAIHNSYGMNGFSLNAVRYGGEVEIDPGCLEGFFLMQIPLVGKAEVRNGNRTVYSMPGKTASLLSPTRETNMLWQDSCGQMIVFFDRKVVENRLSRLLDRHVDEVVFDPEFSLDTPSGQAFMAQVNYLQSVIEQNNGVPNHTQSLILESLINTLLVMQNHNFSAFIDGSPTSLIVPKHIKRAFEYISENYSNANVCEQVPLYAGMSIRTLQAGFRKHYGKTITQSIQDIRLDELKKRIDQNSSGAPVSELMLDVGLSHFSRAAAAYKQRFGVSPSQVKKQFLISPCEQ